MRITNYQLVLVSVLTFTSSVVWSETLADPTQPYGYSKNSSLAPSQATNDSAPKWLLNTTIIDPYQRIAIVNGTQVTVGDEINGATVIAINHQEVELLDDRDLIVLSLKKSAFTRHKPTQP